MKYFTLAIMVSSLSAFASDYLVFNEGLSIKRASIEVVAMKDTHIELSTASATFLLEPILIKDQSDHDALVALYRAVMIHLNSPESIPSDLKERSDLQIQYMKWAQDETTPTPVRRSITAQTLALDSEIPISSWKEK